MTEQRKEPYNMPSIEKDGHQWIRMVDHIALLDEEVEKAREEVQISRDGKYVKIGEKIYKETDGEWNELQPKEINK